MNQNTIAAYAVDLNNWVRFGDAAKEYNSKFTPSQFKTLFVYRDKHPGLSTCYRKVGRVGYVNKPLFGLWMAGLLPEQQEG